MATIIWSEKSVSDMEEVIVDPYRVVYRTSETEIFIIAVIHGKRLLREEMLA